jgi:hypothetical protein
MFNRLHIYRDFKFFCSYWGLDSGLALARQALYQTCIILLDLFASIIFEIRTHFMLDQHGL